MKQKLKMTILALLSLTLSYGLTSHASAQGRRPSRNQAGPGLTPNGGAKTPVFEFDKSYFEKSLVNALSANSMGYSVVLIKDGQYVTDVTGNRAKSVKDGDVKMTADTPSNIGSSIKFVTGVALLHHFEQAASKGGPTVDQRLEEPIFNYLPQAWQAVAHKSIKQIKFRHLLQHKSGFSTADGIGDVAKDYALYDFLTKGTQRETGTVRDYENINFMLLGYVMAGVVDPGFVHKLDQEINSSKIKPDNVYIRQMLGNRFVKYMREKIYGAMTPKINPSCSPTADYVLANKPVALMYSTIDDKTNGNIWNSQSFEGHCRGQGGWYMSANELAAFMANFSTDGKLISKELREKMFNPSDADARLAWSSNNNNDPWFKATFGQGTYPYHGGDHGEGNGEAHATVLALPHNYYAVGIINSGPLGSANLTRRILDAFRAGVEKKIPG